MAVYINGLGIISPQPAIEQAFSFSENEHLKNKGFLKCIEPDYKNYINPSLLRRMSRIIKMGVASAQICLNDAGIKMPDAIITGTGLGCIEDTEKFLTNIFEGNEALLAPTSFIQSTHNTVGGQIALLLGCHHYNFTYVHRGFSFESALLDAMMILKEKNGENILVGGTDELTPNSYTIMERLGLYKSFQDPESNILQTQTNGSLAGEGSTFFLIASEKTENTYAEIKGLKTFYKPSGEEEIKKNISDFLAENNLSEKEIGLVILGFSGDKEKDHIYQSLSEHTFNQNSIAYFKHLSGEYHTATAFALWLAAEIIKTGNIPEDILTKQKTESTKHILIYNHYENINHSLYLLSKC